MNEDNKYMQDESWDDLPMPGENEAWEKMEALLDKEERKRRGIPPFILNCAGIAAIVLLLSFAGWYFFGGRNAEKNISKTSNEVAGKKQTSDPSVNTSSEKIDNSATTSTGLPADAVNETPDTKTGSSSTNENADPNSLVTTTKQPVKRSIDISDNQIVSDNSNRTAYNRKAKSPKQPVEKTAQQKDKKNRMPKPPVAPLAVTDKGEDHPANKFNVNGQPGKQSNDTMAVAKITTNPTPSKTRPDTVTAIAKPDTTTAVAKKVSTQKPSKYSFSAGLGVQQQLRNGSQVAYDQNYSGNKNLLSEYIPSVYFRAHHKQNWYMQGEFRFGAPQYVKDYSYERRMKYDTISSSLVVSSQRARKIYYHQIPLSFNYNILPGLSIGTGASYNIFYRSIMEEEVRSTNVFTGAESLSKFTTRQSGYNDSFFFKSQWQAMIQADYQWKKLSLGLRYKKDLQPYIRYMKPDGTLQEELNEGLEIILRYQLWRSKKKF